MILSRRLLVEHLSGLFLGLFLLLPMADPAVKEKLSQQGATLIGDEPEHFRRFIADETKKGAKVIKDAGVETAK